MIRTIVFDLDDTLLDTTGLLLPAAAERACNAMLAQGLKCPLKDCLQWRAEFSAQHSHKEIFFKIAERAGHGEKSQELGKTGMLSFYQSPIPPTLPLMNGAAEVLQALHMKYRLYLVTSGSSDTQWDKIRATGAQKFFLKAFVVDKLKQENKKDVFRAIMDLEKIPTNQMLSVGNRLTEEIRAAKQLGWKTCYFEYGEHVGEKMELPEDHPDFRVQGWKDFASLCQL